MNWGTKIIILYSGFVIIVLVSVFFAMTQRVDLVTDNYYEKEIKYQEQIDKLQRTKALKEKTIIILEENKIRIKFPITPEKNNPKDFILLYRPSDPSKDINIIISADSFGFQSVSTEKLAKGFWKIKLNWTSNGVEFYDEGMIDLP